MRKATILMALVLFLSVCGVGVLAADIFEEHNQVVLTEKVIYGDRTKANGLSVQVDSHYRSRLFWNTTLQFNDAADVHTDYSFSAKQIYKGREEEYDGINIHNNVMESVDTYVEEERLQEGIGVAYRELLDETEAGEDKSRNILLKDYISHYPIGFNLDFPNTRLNSSRVDLDLWRDLGTVSESEAHIVQKIRDYFKLPVLEDQYLEIHVSKRADGSRGSWGGGTSRYGDWYDLYGYSVLSDDACYFTFNTLTNDGKVVDTSELPEGYGIYRLPYHMENDGESWGDVSVIDVDQLEMVYPLTPGIQIAYLSLNAAQTCLYLHTVEGGTYTITVIDLSTMEPKQMLDVMHFEDEPSWGISDQDDFMVIDCYHTQELAVVSKDESGKLTLEYICPVQPEEIKDFYSFYSYDTAMDFDGERLVLAQLLDIEFSTEPDYRDRTSCGIQVAVYEEDGMTFFGEYRSSLDTGEDWTDHAFYVHGISHEPVVATWTR